MEIVLADVPFKSKADCQRYLQQLLKLPANTLLVGKDFEMVADLIERHPKAKEKKGSGIKKIWIKKCNDWGKNNQFIIERIDGSLMDFSYKNCLNEKLPSFRQWFNAACRNTIADQIIKFKTDILYKQPIILCQFTGEVLNKDNSHVDHIPPDTFAQIISDFINEHNINIFNVDIVGERIKQFKDITIAGNFKLYHHRRANLRLISAYANTHQYRGYHE